ncbi:hypothetical protein SUW42_05270 [Streptococcus agalactiae]
MNRIDEMTVIEIKVLNIIKNKSSYEKPVKAAHIRSELNLTKRSLEWIIESLRVTHRHPIVAKKNGASGYFLPKNEEEREAGLAPYRRQIMTEQKNLACIRGVNLEEYWKGV